MKENLANFSKDMTAGGVGFALFCLPSNLTILLLSVQANRKDVHIDKDEMKGHPWGARNKPKPPAAIDAEDAKKSTVPSSVVGALSTITMFIEFV
ncbi:hypothetical protein HDU77_008011 [Chytriomyces hyalinus]|nr:hypothetical protein HDU77_008011 [Chytriomyces hyalinus]